MCCDTGRIFSLQFYVVSSSAPVARWQANTIWTHSEQTCCPNTVLLIIISAKKSSAYIKWTLDSLNVCTCLSCLYHHDDVSRSGSKQRALHYFCKETWCGGRKRGGRKAAENVTEVTKTLLSESEAHSVPKCFQDSEHSVSREHKLTATNHSPRYYQEVKTRMNIDDG